MRIFRRDEIGIEPDALQQFTDRGVDLGPLDLRAVQFQWPPEMMGDGVSGLSEAKGSWKIICTERR